MDKPYVGPSVSTFADVLASEARVSDVTRSSIDLVNSNALSMQNKLGGTSIDEHSIGVVSRRRTHSNHSDVSITNSTTSTSRKRRFISSGAPPSYSTRQLAATISTSRPQEPTSTDSVYNRSISRLSAPRVSLNSFERTPLSASDSVKPPPGSYPSFSAPVATRDRQTRSSSIKSHRTTSLIRNNCQGTKDRYDDTASESGASVLSTFHPNPILKRQHQARRTLYESSSEERRKTMQRTNSPLRGWTKWSESGLGVKWTLIASIGIAILVKCITSLGEYSGYGVSPLRGDLEAQRHWLALTSSTLKLPFLHLSSSSYANNASLSITQWYRHDYNYWRLDYPPLTAYHSLFLGFLARLSARTAEFVTFRPPSNASATDLGRWDRQMTLLEEQGEMKAWMRVTVIIGDLLVYVSAVVVYCSKRYAKKDGGGRRVRPVVVAILTILLQPALILIDNGHFQYNSLMLGFTLWSLNCFQAGHDLLGAIMFVCALGFKQMALYYSPAIFAYLLGKCFYLRGREGASLFINLGFVTLSMFALLLAPFLSNPSEILQILSRVFPFSRGLFEDKVANFWCAINVVVKLRLLASIPTLARLASLVTLVAVLPSVTGMIWISHKMGRRSSKEARDLVDKAETVEPPTATIPTFNLLPHALTMSSMAFFLFSFQVHEKSILLPLMPLTLMMGAREAGFGRMEWEWGVLLNNVGVFSMWPLLKRDGVGLAYVTLTLGWNYAIGYNPIDLRRSFVKFLSLATYVCIVLLHMAELLASPPEHLPDLFVVMNLTLSAGVFGIGYLWTSKRAIQEGWALLGMQ